MPNNGIGFSANNAATGQPIVFVNEAATLTCTLTNQTGAPITFSATGSVSEMDIYMPLFYTSGELGVMSISLAGWDFAANGNAGMLTLRYNGQSSSTWADGANLTFDITNATSTASPASDSVQVNFVNFGGSVPTQVTSPLALNNPPTPGNADLGKALQVTLDNQGLVIVSAEGDPLQNTLILNFKNVSGADLYTGEQMWTGTPTVTVTFVYGSTSGSLAPDDDKAHPVTGSAWEIVGSVAYAQGNEWTVTNPQSGSVMPHPQWTLAPANTNQGIIGTGDAANIAFSFGDIVSFTPPGHTQMMVQFSGFWKDETTKYDDAVFVLDIVKQDPPANRGILNFFSQTAFYAITEPTQPVPVALRWSLFEVASVSVLASYPGVGMVTQSYPNAGPIVSGAATITLPGAVQDTAVTFVLQAYDGNGGYLGSMQFTVFIQANMFVDTRDGQVYPVLQAGNRVWVAANLNYTAPNNGSAYYANNSGYATPYGQLYTQPAAQYQVPVGWRLPSVADWNALIAVYGDASQAYAALIAGGGSGFNAQLGGEITGGSSTQMTQYGFYWTSTPQGSQAVYAGFSSRSLTVSTVGALATSSMLSVRYVRDVA
jgi:uncharacterized protein (TIGR02145 family)